MANIDVLDVQRGSPGFEGHIVHCRPAVSYTARPRREVARIRAAPGIGFK